MHHDELDPLALLHSARRGDQAAARRLWSLFAPRLQALARGLLTTPDAADIVQNVFITLVRLPESRARAIRDLAAFLVVSTRNACHNANRAAARRTSTLATWRAHYESPENPDPAQPGAFEALHAALSRLDPSLRELVLLKHVGGLTFDQMAACLGERRGTLVSRYRQSLDMLQRALANGTSPVQETTRPFARLPVIQEVRP